MALSNPYRPGAGHRPPYLAGREREKAEFERLLDQDVILENMVLTGLRGVGKTVLSEEFRPMASKNGWIWAGSDLSETVSVSEDNLALRILTDISVFTSSIVVEEHQRPIVGFTSFPEKVSVKLGFDVLKQIYENIPGLTSDKLKGVLEFVYSFLPAERNRIIFAYDEAQNLSDNAAKDQYPLSVLLDVFQSIQRKNIPFMLVLVGLPTLFPKLVEARTYAERMFRVVFLDQLDADSSKKAIVKPLESSEYPIKPTDESILLICDVSGGYPYFIQFICREIFDIWIQNDKASIPIDDIVVKLDTDFFAGRWARVSDRQRELLCVIAKLNNSDSEFSVQDIVSESQSLSKPFGSSHVNQMLSKLAERGLIYKNRHGKYSFAVPLFGRFLRRQEEFMQEVYPSKPPGRLF